MFHVQILSKTHESRRGVHTRVARFVIFGFPDAANTLRFCCTVIIAHVERRATGRRRPRASGDKAARRTGGRAVAQRAADDGARQNVDRRRRG